MRFGIFRPGLFALATLSFITCTADSPSPQLGDTEQSAVTPLPSNLNLALNAKSTVTIGPLSAINGDVGSSGLTGSVLFDISSTQAVSRNVLANTVRVRAGASVGNVFGNDIIVDGTNASQNIGVDPAALPQVPSVTAAAPGATNLSVAASQAKQVCAGQYGAVALAANATLNLNGGVYHMTRLTLGEGAKLVPSEPVVLVVAGNLSAGTGSFIGPFSVVVNPMSAADIRIEVGGAATLGANSETHAHLLVGGKLSTLKDAKFFGAAWANIISIGTSNTVQSEGVFSAQTPATPLACNDNNPCSVDQCVGGGTTVGFCRNTPAPSGTACGDDNLCNGSEVCDGAAQCQSSGAPPAGTSCADGDACNGDETCDGVATCQAGAPPILDDGNTCTADSCDPGAGVEHDPLPDGTSCSGNGVCQAGACTSQGATFSAAFIQNQESPAQCQAWNQFRSELTATSFSSVTMSGSFDPIGVTCDVPAIATQICQGLHDATPLSVFCNGRTWNIGSCGGDTAELSANGATCVCDSGYVARPCIGPGNDNWGGMNTSTCAAPSQTMTVTCQ